MNGKVIWLTGISGAGKTTLGNQLCLEFQKRSLRVQMLDGDLIRDFFENDLGYEQADRVFNVKRITFGAYVLARAGVNVVVANIAPYYSVRDFIRRKLGEDYIQIFLDATVESVIIRDVKGHYNNFKSGKISSLVGIDEKYEIPRKPDLRICTSEEMPEISLQRIVCLLKERNVF